MRGASHVHMRREACQAKHFLSVANFVDGLVGVANKQGSFLRPPKIRLHALVGWPSTGTADSVHLPRVQRVISVANVLAILADEGVGMDAYLHGRLIVSMTQVGIPV